MSKLIYSFTDNEIENIICGPVDKNIVIMSQELDLELLHFNSGIYLNEESLSNLIEPIFDTLTNIVKKDLDIETRDIVHICSLFKNSNNIDQTKEEIENFYLDKPVFLNTFEGNKIYAKTLIQASYFYALRDNDIVFVSGSAGTGKTYLAVAYAVSLLKKHKIKKIIITRPAVEAGEKLGFLPGDLKEKVDPYLVPIYDALSDFLGKENMDKLMEKGQIEVAPLAYMRGRTLDNACIILDEAQNTTTNQMKMFITRLGFNSKMIITGDLSQIDIPHNNYSGMEEAIMKLQKINGIGFIHFSKYDVMRHPLVSKVLERYGDE